MASQAEQLRLAAAAGQADKVRELLLAGAKIDPDLEGRTALHRAAANGHLATVKALLDAGAKINARDAAGYTPLHQAATEGHQEVVQLLLKQGCHVDAQDEMHGNTALHEAAWKGFSKTVESLCRSKANVYIKNNGGFTPLHLTCQNGHNQSCRNILLAACKPDVRNSYGDTPLHTAARYGHAGVLRILISAFCSVNEVNKNGDSALHIAAAMGKRKLTRILLEANCDQKIKNNQNETARDIAERKGFTEVVEILDNPPVTLIPVPEKEKSKSRSSSRKNEKDSGTSQDSATKNKKEKNKKNKKKQNVHFSPDDPKGNKSPYGCHMYPNLEFFPSIKIKSLPEEPLQKGEQYYADLAGNIKKGPRGLGYACYCAPFFNHVEKRMDENKNELLKRIDDKSEDLKAKITHLEQRTHDQLVNLNQRMKESLAFERADCCERMDRRLLRERLELQNSQQNGIQALRSEVKTWVHQPNGHVNGIAISNVPRCQMNNAYPLSRSRSADLLSETDSHQWSTDVTSTNHNPSQTHNGNFLNYAKQKFGVSSKNNGAKPKYTTGTGLSPKMSRWKAKCYGNSILTRDSRSEGDLTSCHTEVTERSPQTRRYNKSIPLHVEDSKPLRNIISPNHVHNQPVLYHKPQLEPTGALWKREPLRTRVTCNEDTLRVPPTVSVNKVGNHYSTQPPHSTSLTPLRETSVLNQNCPTSQPNGRTNLGDVRTTQENGNAVRLHTDESSFV